MTTLRSRAAVLITSGALAAGAVLGTAIAGTAVPAGAAVPACGNSALVVSHAAVQGATGHGSFVLLFRNASASTCTIYGYPGLDALDASGQVLAHAQRTLHGFAGGAHVEATVSLAPGRYASATVEWLNFNPVTTGDCTFSKTVATTPANTTHTVRLAVSVSICQLQVHPTVAGSTGSDGYALAAEQWQQGAGAISAQQSAYWAKAAAYLGTEPSAYATAIAQLTQLISLPDADQTPAQNAEYHHDITALNTFFGTPGLYS